ncbi:nicotinic acid mononucleotide adenylyltransferase [Erwinia sp. OLTSP20]|nr:nicotinic acid mononucleotide adenylyltransferase [Erwinia sp. OAMSP11]PIJ69420.1 nicotinic acid mononucleotide adenylyltransferase [Erwinia sp. OLSSP12]PIJ79254.1 nicotinic acid mononucleotide adenylyltransferase [Erwinia sp. OLCASP19]PIJ80780.1 nicotinic acid mononucleotide adenylyltransferase [Erwinia sp. OLMTSP26]PIJ82932.1 nicotinic acid mononucleotide adenylyltransferase [Erwinia sp. OLMDSP33]PIJ91784.1 nicotinic acid mononucleotide adenylyltransferase [Erwinia sp. OLFS4]PIJ94640.1 n
MTANLALYALLGGTFDPIHYGHLKPAEALARQVGLGKVTLMPNNVPPHRPQPEASAAQRLTMLRLAIRGRPLFDIDERELQHHAPSYTLDTLQTLRAERGDRQPLAFIIGQDSLLTLPSWHGGYSLLNYCHLLVCQRPGYNQQMKTEDDQRWLQQHQVNDPRRLHQQPAGCIFLAQTPLINISATEIRQRRHLGQACDDLLPAAVSQFMDREGLYRDLRPA